jgi:hypothetical protein
MRKPFVYTDEPMNVGEIIPSFFLPSPDQLVFKPAMKKVTLQFNSDSIDFFKRHAKKQRVPYQQMLRAVVDHYVAQQQALEAQHPQ